ncbi:MAG TPA: hypothetical protein PK365_12230 [Nitrospira sp.]|nr:hypothetical protein [Nitrospira sp.]HNG01988.1 hypothetical protein [Nitrospira sp.]HNI18234.1 hypothetical protein [Nitrospira sp.]
MAVSHVKSNPVANMTGTVTVFNSAGVTTTAAATDLVRPLDWNSAHNQFMTIGGNTVGASTLSGTNIVFEGAGAVTLSGNADTLVFSAPVQTAFVLSNSNGLTFGTNVSTVTASHNGLTSQSNQAYSAGNGSAAFQTLTFANSNGVSFSTGTQGLFGTVKTDYASSNHSHGNPTLALTNLSGTTASNSAGLTLSLSAAAAGGAATATLYATGNTTQSSTGTMALSSMIVRGAGGISAGISNGSIVVSGPDLTSLAATGALSASSNGSTISLGVGTVTVSAVSNTTQNSSGTVNLNALQIQGAGVASVGLSNGSVVISVPSGGGAGDGGNVIAAGTQTGTSLGTIKFENSNGITFGMSGSTQVTASHNGLTTARASNDAIGLNTAQTNVTWTVNSSGLSLNAAGYAGTGTTFNGTNASASMTLNSNGLRLDLSAANGGGGVNTGTFYATGNTTQSSSGTIALSSIIVQGTGGVSAGVSNGSIVVSGPAFTSLSATGALSVSSNGSTISLGVGTVTVSATGNTTQASSGTVNLNGLILQGTGGASVGISNGSIVISGATGGAGGGAAISAGANSQSTGTVNFANSNGITFGLSNNGTMTASYNSTQFAGTGTTFAGANISASMTLNSNGLNLSASVAAPGAAAENNNINLLGANTAGNTTASGSTIGLSGLNLTLSGTNASQVVISAPATSSLVGVGGISISTNGSTISISQVPSSRYVNENAVTTTGLAADRSSVSIVPFMIQHQLDMSNMRCLISMSGQTTTNNSTNGAAISISGVLYSLNGSSLSSILSGSNTYTGTWSSNATASVFGARALTMNFNNTTRLAPGEYWWAVHVSSATTAANTSGTSNLTHAFTMGIGAANLTQMLGADPWGQATAATRGVSVGLGILSTGATRASIAISEIQQTGSRAQAAKLWLDMRNYSVW